MVYLCWIWKKPRKNANKKDRKEAFPLYILPLAGQAALPFLLRVPEQKGAFFPATHIPFDQIPEGMFSSQVSAGETNGKL